MVATPSPCLSTDRAKSRFWLVLDDETVDLCLTDPGFEVDLYVVGHVAALARYWLGQAEIADLIRRGELSVDGPRALVMAFPSWFLQNVFAAVGPARAEAGGP